MPTTDISALLWAGTDSSQVEAEAALERYRADMSAGTLSQWDTDEEEDDLPYNLTVHGSVGLISTRGPLVNEDSPYLRYYGLTSYADIRRAFLAAAERQDIKVVLHDIVSGGGAVSGMMDSARLIRTIDQNIKPVYSFTDGVMASAAYCLGVSAREIYASDTSVLGSIGVIMTHVERSAALEKAGFKATVLRVGKYKALVNSVEPLTEEAKSQALAQMQAVYSVFLAHVASGRKVTVDFADSSMGQGREFVGQAAVGANLIDAVTTFDALMSRISANIAADATFSPQRQHTQTTSTMKKALTEQQVAALAAGAPVVAAGTPEPVTSAPASPEQGAAGPEASTEPESTAPQQPPAADTGAKGEVVAFLRDELRSSQEALATVKAELALATNQLKAMAVTQKGLRDIAAQSLSNMRVALSQPPLDAEGMSDEALLALHGSTTEKFRAAFKVGGVAAAAPIESTDVPKSAGPVSIDAYTAARRAGIGFSK